MKLSGEMRGMFFLRFDVISKQKNVTTSEWAVGVAQLRADSVSSARIAADKREAFAPLTSTLVKRLSSSTASGIGCLGALRMLPLRAWGPPRLPMPMLGWHEWWGTPALTPPTKTSRTPPSLSPLRLCTMPMSPLTRARARARTRRAGRILRTEMFGDVESRRCRTARRSTARRGTYHDGAHIHERE